MTDLRTPDDTDRAILAEAEAAINMTAAEREAMFRMSADVATSADVVARAVNTDRLNGSVRHALIRQIDAAAKRRQSAAANYARAVEDVEASRCSWLAAGADLAEGVAALDALDAATPS